MSFGTGTGKAGTYNLSISQTAGSGVIKIDYNYSETNCEGVRASGRHHSIVVHGPLPGK